MRLETRLRCLSRLRVHTHAHTSRSILDKLGLPISAEDWLRHASKLAAKGDNSSTILFQRVRAKRLYDPLTHDMPVEVTFTNQGRSVRTKQAIKKGEVIFADRPLLLAQTLPSRKFPCCSNCATSLIKPEDVFSKEELQKPALQKAVKKHFPIRPRVYCACEKEIYCSEKCKEEAWENEHKLICPEKNPATLKLHEVCDSYDKLTSQDVSAFNGWWNASFSPTLLAKLWSSIVCSAQKRAAENGRAAPSAQDWALARAPFRRFIAYGEGTQAQTIPKMHELFVEIFKDLGNGLSYPITSKEFAGRYLQLACNVQSFSDADNPMAHFCRGIHKDRQFAIMLDYCLSKEHEGDFAGLFPQESERERTSDGLSLDPVLIHSTHTVQLRSSFTYGTQ
nr:hypothetical protein BaRGS_003612 [Batillaria attramentaria]